jgi:ornithine cyclodeaminase/alanine dehydrogenase-like protein (mu-crystallin family)
VNVIARGECDEGTILRAARIACSWREQILRDTPDFRPVPDLVRRGAIAESAFLDLDQVIVDPGQRRPSPESLTVFLSQGVGLWDAALGGLVYDRAVVRGVGRELTLAGEGTAARRGRL